MNLKFSICQHRCFGHSKVFNLILVSPILIFHLQWKLNTHKIYQLWRFLIGNYLCIRSAQKDLLTYFWLPLPWLTILNGNTTPTICISFEVFHLAIHISMAWCKTIVTTSIYITNYNSFAPQFVFKVTKKVFMTYFEVPQPPTRKQDTHCIYSIDNSLITYDSPPPLCFPTQGGIDQGNTGTKLLLWLGQVNGSV